MEGSIKWDHVRIMSERYNDFVIQHLKKLWLEMGQLCSRRMKKAIPRWIVHYDVPEVTKHLLLQMSKTTIDVYLRPYKAQYRLHWNSGTKVNCFKHKMEGDCPVMRQSPG